MVLTVAILLVRMGSYPLIDPDEGRNAAVAREMAVTNHYLVPRLNGLPYLDKPFLFFALDAAAIETLGPSERAARLPSLLFTLLTVLLVAWHARHLDGGEAGWIAAAALLTTPLTIAFATTVIFDGVLTFFVTLALIAFHRAVEEIKGASVRTPSRWTLVAWMAMGLGVLTKGPVALALPLLVAAPYAVWRRAWRGVLDPFGALTFGLVV